MSKILNLSTIALFTVIALILEIIGINYILILILIGLTVSFITGHKKYGIISSVLYTVLGFIITYPGSLFIESLLPTANTPVDVSPLTTATNLFVGMLIPSIVAIFITLLAGIVGKYLRSIILKNKDPNNAKNNKNKKQTFFHKKQNRKIINKKRKEILHSNPIQKIKDEKNRK